MLHERNTEFRRIEEYCENVKLEESFRHDMEVQFRRKKKKGKSTVTRCERVLGNALHSKNPKL